MTMQAFDQLPPIIVSPSEIRAGDWMRDLGMLRQVESVKVAADHADCGVSVRFAGGVDGYFGTLSVPQGIPVTVWRKLPRQDSGGHSETPDHAAA